MAAACCEDADRRDDAAQAIAFPLLVMVNAILAAAPLPVTDAARRNQKAFSSRSKRAVKQLKPLHHRLGGEYVLFRVTPAHQCKVHCSAGLRRHMQLVSRFISPCAAQLRAFVKNGPQEAATPAVQPAAAGASGQTRALHLLQAPTHLLQTPMLPLKWQHSSQPHHEQPLGSNACEPHDSRGLLSRWPAVSSRPPARHSCGSCMRLRAVDPCPWVSQRGSCVRCCSRCSRTISQICLSTCGK